MERIKRFFRDETATAEATSTAIMIAGVGVLLGVGIIAWDTGLNTAFQDLGTSAKDAGAAPWKIPQ